MSPLWLLLLLPAFVAGHCLAVRAATRKVDRLCRKLNLVPGSDGIMSRYWQRKLYLMRMQAEVDRRRLEAEAQQARQRDAAARIGFLMGTLFLPRL